MKNNNIGIGRSIIELSAYCIKHDKHLIVSKGVHKGFMSNKGAYEGL